MNQALQIVKDHYSWSPKKIQPLSGGSINDVYKVQLDTKSYVVKINRADRFPSMFALEAEGLNELRKSLFTVPEVVDFLVLQNYQFLILAYIDSSSKKPEFWKIFAEKLAAMHRIKAPYFGQLSDNYMGALLQSNSNRSNWSDFFIQERIAPQLNLSVQKGFFGQDFKDRLINKLKDFLHETNNPGLSPVLVHGDLWSGNFMVDDKGLPALIDPAAHYGHRETDIAMSKMFGGFAPEFYKYYNEAYPMEEGWETRTYIYQLYPLLIHVNLFGSGYVSGVKSIFNLL